MEEQVVYVVIKKAYGLTMTDKAFMSIHKAKAYANVMNKAMSAQLKVSARYYVEKCFLRK
ncbi:hypothetical protein [Paucilactobacillus sp. N302-9]